MVGDGERRGSRRIDDRGATRVASDVLGEGVEGRVRACGDGSMIEQAAEVGGEGVDGLVAFRGLVAPRGADDEREVGGDRQRRARDVLVIHERRQHGADREDVGAGVDGGGVARAVRGS
jgi:hypothetical protein